MNEQRLEESIMPMKKWYKLTDHDFENMSARRLFLDSTLASILIRMLKIKRDCDDEEARTYPDGDGGWRKA
jgi:hypothetical protein